MIHAEYKAGVAYWGQQHHFIQTASILVEIYLQGNDQLTGGYEIDNTPRILIDAGTVRECVLSLMSPKGRNGKVL